jgi:hypothetical protein
MKDWMRDIQPGHKLRPSPVWNNTERPYRQLRVPTTVLDTKRQNGCQSGLLLKVEFKGGGHSWVDAGWFCKPNSRYPLDAL